jgi:hypothetical protein
MREERGPVVAVPAVAQQAFRYGISEGRIN